MPNNFPEQDPGDGQVLTTRPNGRKRVVTINNSESATVQSDVHESEIRHIMARYEQTGILPRLSGGDLAFRDITSFDDYAEAMRHAETAKLEFMELDPRIRRVFNQDHLAWLDAAHDGLTPEQAQQLQKLGVLKASETLPHDSPAINNAVGESVPDGATTSD